MYAESEFQFLILYGIGIPIASAAVGKLRDNRLTASYGR
jgi:hypothetical protein